MEGPWTACDGMRIVVVVAFPTQFGLEQINIQVVGNH